MTWGRIYLWIAILIFAAAASVVARLVEIGEANLIDGRNPISFCNLLFAGNLVAALTLLALYHREWRPARLRSLSPRQWLIQTALALTSGAIAPAMMFTAIAHTSVTNIVLIETIEIPLGLLLAWLLYREKSSWSAVLGALCALVGVATTLVLQMDASPESMAAARMQGGMGHGEFFAAAATVLLVCGAEIGRKQLQTIPLGHLQRLPQYSRRALLPRNWPIRFWPLTTSPTSSPRCYGAGCCCTEGSWWLVVSWRGLPASSACAPPILPRPRPFRQMAGVLFAALILGEVPMPAQLIGGGIILVGIAIALWGELRATRPTRPPKTDDKAKAFTGV